PFICQSRSVETVIVIRSGTDRCEPDELGFRFGLPVALVIRELPLCSARSSASRCSQRAQLNRKARASLASGSLAADRGGFPGIVREDEDSDDGWCGVVWGSCPVAAFVTVRMSCGDIPVCQCRHSQRVGLGGTWRSTR